MFTMNRAEIIEFIAAEIDLSKAATGRVLDVLPETIQKTVKQGEALQLVLQVHETRSAHSTHGRSIEDSGRHSSQVCGWRKVQGCGGLQGRADQSSKSCQVIWTD